MLHRVGEPGDKGIVEISDFLFTVQGPTAGAVLVEWNVHEDTQGSAGMWDCHFRGEDINPCNTEYALSKPMLTP